MGGNDRDADCDPVDNPLGCIGCVKGWDYCLECPIVKERLGFRRETSSEDRNRG